MPENDTHELVSIKTSVRWDLAHTFQWECSCGAMSAVRWANTLKAEASHVVHQHQEENDARDSN